MFNLPSIRPILIKDVEANDLSLSERVIYWTIILTPVWWLLGIQSLFYPLVMVSLLAIHFNWDRLVREGIPIAIWAWLVMSIVMLWTAVLGINALGFSILPVAAAVVTFFKSYFLIFACLALPFWSQVRTPVITRAVAWMASGYLVAISVQVTLLTLKIGGSGFIPPLARLIPADKGSLRVDLAFPSSFFGLPVPRTVLYTPDPPILGLCAVLCFLICLHESDLRLRYLALLGCIGALVVSASRSALLVLPFALLIGLLFRSGLFRQLSLWLASATFLICSMLSLTIGELFDKPSEALNKTRDNAVSSSIERELVVRKTLEAWQESPLIGWGIIRDKINLYEDNYITLASFSTYSAVLYLHGIVGFIVLIGAMALTLWHVYRAASRGRVECEGAFAGLVALYIACNATPLSWMAVYLWFFFVWLGTVIYDTRTPPAKL
jgi:O-antigen ligase